MKNNNNTIISISRDNWKNGHGALCVSFGEKSFTVYREKDAARVAALLEEGREADAAAFAASDLVKAAKGKRAAITPQAIAEKAAARVAALEKEHTEAAAKLAELAEELTAAKAEAEAAKKAAEEAAKKAEAEKAKRAEAEAAKKAEAEKKAAEKAKREAAKAKKAAETVKKAAAKVDANNAAALLEGMSEEARAALLAALTANNGAA